MEMNFHKSENEDPTAEEIADPVIQKHLRYIKLKIAKNKAELKKNQYQSIFEEIVRIRNMGVDELKKILSPSESLQLQPLFSKFESLSEKDQQSLAEDVELLQLLQLLKEKIEKFSPDA
jgi:hypothetical protein